MESVVRILTGLIQPDSSIFPSEIMERPSRSLRKLPGRPSEEGRTKTKTSPSPKKAASPGRKPTRDKTPPRRSRSRSTGRKKLANKVEERKTSPVKASAKTKSVSPSKNKSASPSRTGLVSRVKDSVEKFTKSLSPEIETFVRSSMSRFEEVTNDVVRRSITPRATTVSSTVSTRSALRLRSSANNVDKSQEVEYSEEKTVKNHVGKKNQENKHESSEGKLKILFSISLVFLMLLFTAATIAAHVVCTRDDCRLMVPNVQKFLNYSMYVGYVWPAFSGSLLVLFASARFFQVQFKNAPYISILGLTWLLIATGSLSACHFYFAGLRKLAFLPFVCASLFHHLIFVALSANSNSVLGVKIPSLVYRLSGLGSLVIASWIAAAESNRTVPNITVYALTALQALNAADSLVFEPILNRTTPMYLLLLVLRPLLVSLLPIFVSANNTKIHIGHLAAVVTVNILGYLLYRYSLYRKGRYLSDPYSHYQKLGYSEYAEGPWRLVRHPDLLGRLLAELGLSAVLAPHPLSAGLAGAALISNLAEAWYLDRHSTDTRTPRKSLIPFVY